MWKGEDTNNEAAQQAFLERCRVNGEAQVTTAAAAYHIFHLSPVCHVPVCAPVQAQTDNRREPPKHRAVVLKAAVGSRGFWPLVESVSSDLTLIISPFLLPSVDTSLLAFILLSCIWKLEQLGIYKGGSGDTKSLFQSNYTY